jgi:hypothetical protein
VKALVRAKFKVVKKEALEADGGAKIVLQAVCGGSPENEQFFKYTPSGEIVMQTVNPEAAVQFEEGKEGYVDFNF